MKNQLKEILQKIEDRIEYHDEKAVFSIDNGLNLQAAFNNEVEKELKQIRYFVKNKIKDSELSSLQFESLREVVHLLIKNHRKVFLDLEINSETKKEVCFLTGYSTDILE